MKQYTQQPSLLALSPLFIFLGVYLVTSLIADDFYKVPITVAFVISSIAAIAMTRHLGLSERIAHFSGGASDKNILLMIWIFILAGAFAQSAKAMGAIDATVNLTLHILPDNLLLAGIFIAACFISLSVGTSVGTIVALTPVAVGIADKTGVELAYMVAIVVGGAFFGDNLSFISDTTIAATKTQGCEMRDKFKVNSLIVMPAAILLLFYYVFAGMHIHTPTQIEAVEWIKVIHLFGWFGAMGAGITGMGELIIITLLAGGMLEMIRYNGGIDYIIVKLTRHVNSKRAGELSIAGLVCLANLCTANNTIAVITIGPIAKSASILDTFSCFIQGIIPYGAQMLIAAGLASISPLSIIQYLYYPMLIGICALSAIVFRYPRRYS